MEMINKGLNIDKMSFIFKNNNLSRIDFFGANHINEQDNHKIANVKNQIREYLSGDRQTFNVPYELNVTPFQRLVLDAISRIPYGSTLTYKALAKVIGRPNAIRAVGTACRKNPLPIIIPCHRVVRSDGHPGEYSGGNELKSFLLDLEKK